MSIDYVALAAQLNRGFETNFLPSHYSYVIGYLREHYARKNGKDIPDELVPAVLRRIHRGVGDEGARFTDIEQHIERLTKRLAERRKRQIAF